MRRFCRWAFNGAAAVSLALLVATAGAWARAWLNRPEPAYLFIYAPDQRSALLVTASEQAGLDVYWTRGDAGGGGLIADVDLPGVWVVTASGPAGSMTLVRLGFWLLVTAGLALPAVWLVRWRRSRARHGAAGFPVAVGRVGG